MLTRTPNRYIIQFTDMTKQDANYENAESKSLRVHEDGHHAEQLIDYIYSRFLKKITVESWNLSDIHVSIEDKLDMVVDFSKMDISLL